MRTSFLQEFLLSIFCYSKNTYYTVHSGILEYYFPKNSWLSKLIYQNKNKFFFSYSKRPDFRKSKIKHKQRGILKKRQLYNAKV
jgi:hypothetical protein